MYDYDLFVIGAGSGGVRAARMAAATGAKVGICEDQYFGGTCVNVGCVPKKLMVFASQVPDESQDAEGYGWQHQGAQFNWNTLIANKDQEIQRLNGIYQKLLDNAQVKVHWGRGQLQDAHTVQVGEERISADKILIAVGNKPVMPALPGIEHAISSNEVFYLPEQPKRVAVVGGGYIAVEFAGIFNGLGSKTHLIYRGEQVLRGFDDDVRNHLAEQMLAKGIDVQTETNITAIDKLDSGLRLHLTNGETLDVDQVMYATGRSPNVETLGLDNAGVATGRNGVITVDDYSRTNIDNIYAIGDVTDRLALTPVATMEAMALVDTLFKDTPTKPDHDTVPTAVFSQPPIGTVGLAEHEAVARGHQVKVYKSAFKPMKLSLSKRQERTLMKLIVDEQTDRVLGMHMVGPEAGEIIQGFAVAVKMGATKAQFDATVGIHPTMAEEFVTMR